MILFVLGILLIGIGPILISVLFQKVTNGFRNGKYNTYIIYYMTLANIFAFFLYDKNTDILFGALLGSCLFQLLVIGG